MKIAIITIHRIFNYGSVLQTYATQQIFRKYSSDVEVIDYITPQRTIKKVLFGSTNKSIGLNGALYHILKIGSVTLKLITFGGFINKNLRLTKKYANIQELVESPPQADLYVTGSDQTWNSVYNEGVDRGFFLDFLPEDANRIAFVASFGKEKLDPNEIDETKKYLSKYKAISVREDSAVSIIEDLGINGAVQLIDPTLQISSSEWLKIASPRIIKCGYVILMLLYNEDNGATEYARKIADENNLKLVKISWEIKKPYNIDVLKTHRSPSDFLSLFYYADYVVTNSFHGLAFAINFHKQFIIVPRNEFNSRITSLLRLTKTEDRLISNKGQFMDYKKHIDYERIEGILEKERNKASKFLENAISSME